MLKEEEIQFMLYWEKVREQQSTFMSKIMNGIPMAFLFSLPVLFSLAIVHFLSPDWFAKISHRAVTVAFSIVLAVFLCALFYAYFRMQFKWEMNEQLYQELKKKYDHQNNNHS